MIFIDQNKPLLTNMDANLLDLFISTQNKLHHNVILTSMKAVANIIELNIFGKASTLTIHQILQWIYEQSNTTATFLSKVWTLTCNYIWNGPELSPIRNKLHFCYSWGYSWAASYPFPMSWNTRITSFICPSTFSRHRANGSENSHWKWVHNDTSAEVQCLKIMHH